MKLGMLTACLPAWTLDQLADLGATTGYEALEVAVGPVIERREFEAAHLPLSAFTDADEASARTTLAHNGLTISALAYYEHNLHPDPERVSPVQSMNVIWDRSTTTTVGRSTATASSSIRVRSGIAARSSSPVNRRRCVSASHATSAA
jgi:hypothetical protein